MNRNIRVALVAAAAWAASGPVQAQSSTRIYSAPRAFSFDSDDPNAARIGVYLGENGTRDTLGVLVNSVVENGPAAKAGIKEGDRIQAIGGVNLKMTRDDAGDDALSGMMSRRLVRELDKLKAGDEVELRVYSGGATKTVRVKTAASRDIEPSTTVTSKRAPTLQEFRDDRAALGLSLGGPVTKGKVVMSVTPDGPAEKAGIVEGDRIAKINGTDLRVPSQEAGDPDLSRARSRRLNQEIAKLSAGDAVTLTVVSAGRSRDVNVTAVRATELNDDGFSFFFNGDGAFTFPRFENFKFEPHTEMRTLPRGGTYFFDGGKLRADIQEQVDRAMKEAGRYMDREDVREKIDRAMEETRKSLEKSKIDGKTYRYRGGDDISDDVREKIERAMEKAHDALEKARKDYDKPVVKRSVIKTS